MKVRILPHPGNVKRDEDDDRQPSGVQTSLGDVFDGDVVELPKDEAGLLIAAGRAKEDEADAPKRGGKKAPAA